MAYQKQTFVNNATVITAEIMQHIEQGIVDNETAIKSINDELDDLDVEVDTTLTQSGKPADAKAVGDKITQMNNSAIKLDTTLTQSGKAADAKVVGDKISKLSEDITNLKNNSGGTSSGGSGLTTTQKALMITLFKNMLSESDMSDTVDELENSFNSESGGESGDNSGSEDGGEDEPSTPTTYTIKYNLTNATSLNSATSITSGNTFTTTLTPSDGYKIDIVTVLMGGIDITETAYNDGVIMIESVSGNINITARTIEANITSSWEDGIPYTLTYIVGEYPNSTTGEITKENSTWTRTGYTNCYGASTIEINYNYYSNSYNAFYNASKNSISTFHIDTGTTFIDVPENAVYFVVSSNESIMKTIEIIPHA